MALEAMVRFSTRNGTSRSHPAATTPRRSSSRSNGHSHRRGVPTRPNTPSPMPTAPSGSPRKYAKPGMQLHRCSRRAPGRRETAARACHVSSLARSSGSRIRATSCSGCGSQQSIEERERFVLRCGLIEQPLRLQAVGRRRRGRRPHPVDVVADPAVLLLASDDVGESGAEAAEARPVANVRAAGCPSSRAVATRVE